MKFQKKARKHLAVILILGASIAIPKTATAIFGADAAAMIPFLVKIIAQTLNTYTQLKHIYDQGEKYRELIEEVNDGISDALGVLDALPIKDEEILGKIRSFREAINEVRSIYGSIPKSPEAGMIRLHDHTVAESIKIANAQKKYANKQESLANTAFNRSKNASPKGSARISAQTSAAILHTLNQLLRINGQMLKLQGEHFAYLNHDSKQRITHYQKVNSDLRESLGKVNFDFETPQFRDREKGE